MGGERECHVGGRGRRVAWRCLSEETHAAGGAEWALRAKLREKGSGGGKRWPLHDIIMANIVWCMS